MIRYKNQGYLCFICGFFNDTFERGFINEPNLCCVTFDWNYTAIIIVMQTSLNSSKFVHTGSGNNQNVIKLLFAQ